MMKKAGFLVLAACAVALCFGLVACGNGKAEDEEKNFIGKWELESTEADDDGISMTAEDVASIKEEGYVCTLNLNEDKSAELSVFGEITDGSWEADGANAGKVTIGDQDIEMRLESDRLVLLQDGYVMTFFLV